MFIFCKILPNLPCFQNDPVDTVNSETASNADDDRWGYDEEEGDFDPDILEDDKRVDEEACDEDNESTVEEQPGENLRYKVKKNK